ncbi:MAG: serine/threonine-protein kinase, partial [archaeon]|nr:serine/threonine-protein kinase [archaeon]
MNQNTGFPEDYNQLNCPVIGMGGFSKVFLVRHRTLGQVAVKEQHKSRSRLELSGAIFDVWRAEQAALEGIGAHAHIVRLYAHWVVDEFRYLSLQYARDNLLAVLKVSHGRLSEELARVVFRQMADALNYAHAAGFVHRDIKLDNILLLEPWTRDPSRIHVLIGDWGFAAPWHALRSFSHHLGTDLYNPPEIHMRCKYCGPEVDVWGMGVVLWCLLAGFFPMSLAELREFPSIVEPRSGVPMVLHAKIAKVALSEEARDLFHCIFKTNPANRISSSNLLRHPWVLGRKLKRNPLTKFMSSSYSAFPRSFAKSLSSS